MTSTNIKFNFIVGMIIFIVINLKLRMCIMSEEGKKDLLEDIKRGGECYKNRTSKFVEEDWIIFKHVDPKSYFKELVKNVNCEGNKDLCIQSAAFGVKSYTNQLCSDTSTDLKSLKKIRTKIANKDFVKLLELGEDCYSKLGEFKSYVKNPATNYNNCFKKCLDNKDQTTLNDCNDTCYENSIINIFKVCELNEIHEGEESQPKN